MSPYKRAICWARDWNIALQCLTLGCGRLSHGTEVCFFSSTVVYFSELQWTEVYISTQPFIMIHFSGVYCISLQCISIHCSVVYCSVLHAGTVCIYLFLGRFRLFSLPQIFIIQFLVHCFFNQLHGYKNIVQFPIRLLWHKKRKTSNFFYSEGDKTHLL